MLLPLLARRRVLLLAVLQLKKRGTAFPCACAVGPPTAAALLPVGAAGVEIFPCNGSTAQDFTADWPQIKVRRTRVINFGPHLSSVSFPLPFTNPHTTA